jgi:SAM-dependent methyltransferase
MNKQTDYPILPKANHDELARQNFIKSLKLYTSKNISPGNRSLYETVAKPAFEQEHHREPESRHEVRQLMEQYPYYHWWSALRRTTQEMMWESLQSSLERQLPYLQEVAKSLENTIGSVTIDPNFKVPAYQKVVDIHCMPGGYHGEFSEADFTAGALYDRGVYLYVVGQMGPLNDDMGQSVVQNFLKKDYPHFQPAKILDMGCSVGHSTLPYVDAYPEAEVYAIDIGAAMVRYAHLRAEQLGKRVHFSQQNAEQTNFPDGSFDLVVSHILLHEIPKPAIQNVLKECYRLLAPGGMMVHAEAPLFQHMDVFSAFMYDWETANNNEPFWSAMRDLDLQKLAIEAGFDAEKVILTSAENGVWKQQLAGTSKGDGFGRRGSWFIFAAGK